jgi:hypothetical protein
MAVECEVVWLWILISHTWPQHVSERESSTGIPGVRNLLQRMKSTIGRRGGTGPAIVSDPRLWSKDQTASGVSESGHYSFDLDDIIGTTVTMAEEASQMELAIADLLRGESVEPSVSVACTLPDLMLYPQAWCATITALAGCPRLRKASLLPHSSAIIQYFLTTGALAPPTPSASYVVVLSCDDWMVECTTWALHPVSASRVEVKAFDMSYMAEPTR